MHDQKRNGTTNSTGSAKSASRAVQNVPKNTELALWAFAPSTCPSTYPCTYSSSKCTTALTYTPPKAAWWLLVPATPKYLSFSRNTSATHFMTGLLIQCWFFLKFPQWLPLQDFLLFMFQVLCIFCPEICSVLSIGVAAHFVVDVPGIVSCRGTERWLSVEGLKDK